MQDVQYRYLRKLLVELRSVNSTALAGQDPRLELPQELVRSLQKIYLITAEADDSVSDLLSNVPMALP